MHRYPQRRAEGTLVPEGLLLESLNPAYQPYTMPITDVLEIWQFHSYRTEQVPEAETDLKTLARLVLELKNDLTPLKRP